MWYANVESEHTFYMKWVARATGKKNYIPHLFGSMFLSSLFSGLSLSDEGFVAWRIDFKVVEDEGQFNDMTQVLI